MIRLATLLTVTCLALGVQGMAHAEEKNSGFGDTLFAETGHPALDDKPVAVVETLESLGDIAPAAGDNTGPSGSATSEEDPGNEDAVPEGANIPLQNVP